ncbi:Hypothetical_protein [Hexamita inflata]|uniref:Hypothetical_protein n=1 Tax=Hexamita inflata TaxID=28002 RepID=A0AA86QBQ7_9EUKA|nr:Hypothetical protein HINF_LOCUS37717 [Hexamita inflata]CAI9958049.1 Hypothetical protein HINF_LOCUS45694 [Hexamita inflata]
MKRVSYKSIMNSNKQKKHKTTQKLKQINSSSNLSDNPNQINPLDEESFGFFQIKMHSLIIQKQNENDTESFTSGSKNGCQSFNNEPKQNDLIDMQDILDIFERL